MPVGMEDRAVVSAWGAGNDYAAADLLKDAVAATTKPKKGSKPLLPAVRRGAKTMSTTSTTRKKIPTKPPGSKRRTPSPARGRRGRTGPLNASGSIGRKEGKRGAGSMSVRSSSAGRSSRAVSRTGRRSAKGKGVARRPTSSRMSSRRPRSVGSRSSRPRSRVSGRSKLSLSLSRGARSSKLSAGKKRRPVSRRAGTASSRRTVSSKGRRSAGKGAVKGKKKGSKKGGSRKEPSLAVQMEKLDERREQEYQAIVLDEEMQREGLHPLYHVLVMELLRTQVNAVNERQRTLNDAFSALQEQGIVTTSGAEARNSIKDIKAQLNSLAVEEANTLRAENASLKGVLDDRRMELEEKTVEAQSLREKLTRNLIRAEVECDSMRAEVQSVIRSEHLDVERMKRELTHRIDRATAGIRTPQYDSALRAMQDLVASVQAEIQEHHDTLTKLVVSIGAVNTFLKDESDTMHSNYPPRYRAELQKLDKDKFLNLLDVLSFQDGVVETVGKALYVMSKAEYQPNVV